MVPGRHKTILECNLQSLMPIIEKNNYETPSDIRRLKVKRGKQGHMYNLVNP